MSKNVFLSSPPMKLMLLVKPNSGVPGIPATLTEVELKVKLLKSVKRIDDPSPNVIINESDALLAPRSFR